MRWFLNMTTSNATASSHEAFDRIIAAGRAALLRAPDRTRGDEPGIPPESPRGRLHLVARGSAESLADLVPMHL
jgi:actin-like ATPase involved in cell morphogenesis